MTSNSGKTNGDDESASAGDFIQRWFESHRDESELDSEILELIDENRSGGELDEGQLLSSLRNHNPGDTSQ
jgi:hypothetical protein